MGKTKILGRRVLGILLSFMLMFTNISADVFAEGQDGNLIVNPTFTAGGNGLESWENYVHVGAGDAAFSKNQDGGVNIEIKNAGTADWHVQLSQKPLTLQAGKAYEVSVQLSSTATRKVFVALQNFKGDNNTSNYVEQTPVLQANEKQTVTMTTNALAEGTSTGKLYIGLGKVKGDDTPASTVTVYSVSVVEMTGEGGNTNPGGSGSGNTGNTGVTQEGNVISNATFENGMTGWTLSGDASSSKNASGGMEIDVKNVGDKNWSVQFFQDKMKLAKGKKYCVSVELEAAVSRSVYVALENFNENNTKQYGSKTAALQAGSRQTISFMTETVAADITNGKLFIGLGQVSGSDGPGKVTIYGVSVVPEEGELPSNDYNKLVWSDEFDGTSLNENNWGYDIGNGGEFNNNPGWGNGELQYYTNRPDNIQVRDGYLTIIAKREDYNGYKYTSARLKTQGKKFFKYGKLEARIKMEKGDGSWPAFWMLGENIGSVGWPKCGEIDIMEYAKQWDHTIGTLHWSNAAENHVWDTKSTSPINVEEWHTYGIIWDETAIRFLCDDVQYHEINITGAEFSEFHENQFFLLNLAVGGSFGGEVNDSIFPNTMTVDYVRVYEKGGEAPVTKVTGITPSESNVNLKVGESKNVSVTVQPENASNKAVIYTSNNTSVANVTSDGKITAVAEGNTTITVEAKDGSGVKATIAVKVEKQTEETPSETPSVKPSEKPSETPSVKPSEKPSEQPSVKPSEKPSETPSVKPSEKPSETPSVKPSEKPSETPSVKPSEKPSEQPSVKPSEQPSETPSVKPSEKPSEQPSVKPSEKPSETPSVEPSEKPSVKPSEQPSGGTVEKPNQVRVTKIEVSPKNVTLKIGETQRLTTKALPENASNRELSFTNNNPNAIAVSADGVITAKAVGTATIKIEAKDGSGVRESVVVIVIPNDAGGNNNNSNNNGNNNNNTANPVAVGTMLYSPKFAYKITNSQAGNYTVELVEPLKTTLKSVTIPATVKYQGITFKVTTIGKNAFKNNKKLNKITIGKNVTGIGAGAFYGCKKLSRVTIKSTGLKTIGRNAFRSIKKKAVIKVPAKKLSNYKKLIKKAKTASSTTVKK